ncbi:MAG: LytTR family DNA-binding domain-containing protein [Bacteroidota bacterium]
MVPIRCLLVDDELPALALLEKYVGTMEQLTVVGKCTSAVHAFEVLNASEVDLLFLDIQMPVLNGIDFLKSLRQPPPVVLTTAHREYALEGYDLDIIDYLLKPISFDRFLRAIDRFRSRGNLPSFTQAEVPPEPDFLFVNINRTHHKVILDDIIYVESLKDYVRIHMPEDRLVVKGNIGSFLRRLPADRFLRVHRSYVIALARVKSYNQSEVEVGAERIPIGVSYREVVQGVLGNV